MFHRLQEMAVALSSEDLLVVIEQWPGLAMLARGDGGVVAASQSWSDIGISAEDLRVNGWKHYVSADDYQVTEAEVHAMSGHTGRPSVRFRNTYTAPDGRESLLGAPGSSMGGGTSTSTASCGKRRQAGHTRSRLCL